MNRCRTARTGPHFLSPLLIPVCAAVLACAVVLLAPTASAQTLVREAPKDVKFGRLVVTQPPEVTLDDKPDRLSPGSRIRNTNNMLLLSGSVVGQNLPVLYRRDAAGLIHEAWVLTPEEASKIENRPTGNGAQALDDLLSLIFGARR